MALEEKPLLSLQGKKDNLLANQNSGTICWNHKLIASNPAKKHRGWKEWQTLGHGNELSIWCWGLEYTENEHKKNTSFYIYYS